MVRRSNARRGSRGASKPKRKAQRNAWPFQLLAALAQLSMNLVISIGVVAVYATNFSSAAVARFALLTSKVVREAYDEQAADATATAATVGVHY